MAMTDEEKKKFLKKMGFSGNLAKPTPKDPPKSKKSDQEMPKNHVDKAELMDLHRIFNSTAKSSD